MANEETRRGRPRRNLETSANPIKSEGTSERGGKFLKENISRDNVRVDVQEQFEQAKIHYKTFHVSNGRSETIKIAKVETLPNGDAYQSLAARLIIKNGKWHVKVGKLDDDMKRVLKDRENVTI